MTKPNKDDLTLKDRQILEKVGYKTLHNTKKKSLIKKKREAFKNKMKLT
jgi:hypothetical protein